jgi:hypothetical protein
MLDTAITLSFEFLFALVLVASVVKCIRHASLALRSSRVVIVRWARSGSACSPSIAFGLGIAQQPDGGVARDRYWG